MRHPFRILFLIALLSGSFFVSIAGQLFEDEDSYIKANDDLIRLFENTSWESFVLNNDDGLQDGVKSFRITRQPKHGSAIVTANNSIIYTPDLYFIGLDNLEYEVCNNSGYCDRAKVSIIVQDYDYQPKAINDTVNVRIWELYDFDVLANDLNLFDLPIKLEIIEDFKNASSEVTANLSISSRFYSYFIGEDVLRYRVCDADDDCDEGLLVVYHRSEDANEIFIPQGFSPDGDGNKTNETFKVPAFSEIENIKIVIVNRNGTPVFQENNFKEWDGRANTGPQNNQLLPSGIYYYKMNVPNIKNEFTGFIYLSR